jgi:hypothetical protein
VEEVEAKWNTVLIRAGIAVVLIVIAAGCAARSPRAYVRVAEGLTSSHLNEAIYLELPRLDPDRLRQGCRNLRRIVRLGTPNNLMEMQIGQPFWLGGLSIIAVDDADVTVSGVPFAIEALDQAPPVLQLRVDDADLGRGILRPLNAGEFLVRAYTLCGIPGAETIINVKVVPVPPVVPPPVFPGQVADR